MAERWPDFFVVGAPRSGTTFFYHFLQSVPGVFVCPLKEPNYFATSIDPRRKLNKPVRSRQRYLALFREARPDQVLCETSPTYLWDPAAAANIHAVAPGARILMILRDPVQRAFSHYLMGLGIGNETEPFIPAMKAALARPDDYSGRIARAGFYAGQVRRYLETFPREQVKIVIHEELVGNEPTVVREVLDVIGVAYPVPDEIPMVTNTFDLPVGRFSSHLIRNPALRWAVRELLPLGAARRLRRLFARRADKPRMTAEEWAFAAELYRPDVAELEELLGHPLPWLQPPAGRTAHSS